MLRNGRVQKLKTVLILVGIGTSLAGCATTGQLALSIKGACGSFQAPTFPVKGQAKRDQVWVDDTTESGVAACGWKRPKASAIVRKVAKPKIAQAQPTVVPAPATVVPETKQPDPPISPPGVVSWWEWVKYWVAH